ncbi:MAG: bifunctional phosphoribosyl-AMP cyclohydrolase/phosphoribosyl-ATP diphosphatase HisIE [Bacteroidota bacterium]
MKVDFKKGNGLVPTVIQDARTLKVLMLGYMNEKSLEKTKKEGKVTFFSRSKERLWTKGETSGNFLFVKEIKVDCDKDTLLILADPVGPVCHTGADTCFDEENISEFAFLHELEHTIHERRIKPLENSHTSKLFKKGINKIAQKVGEEAVELVIEAKDDDDKLFVNEAADLLYHFMILLEAKDMRLKDVVKTLEGRNKVKK